MNEISIRAYLDELRRGLRHLPEPERDDAVREIDSHIAEATAAGQPLAAVLGRLGEPKVLARAYIADHYLQTKRSAWREAWFVLRVSVFVLGSGLVSLCVVPLLAGLFVSFGAVAIVAPVVGILQALGLTSTGVVLWGGPVPAAWSIPVTVPLGLLLALVAWGALRLLRSYVRGVLATYRRVLPEFSR